MALSVELIDVYGPRLTAVNLGARSGALTAIHGASGAGKSAIVRLVCGLERPDSGAVLLAGRDISSSSGRQLRRLQRNMAVMLPGGADNVGGLFASVSVVENITFPLRASGHVAARRIGSVAAEYLVRAGLGAYATEPVDSLSPVQRRRLALARTLAMHAPLIVLDDLDPSGGPGEADIICQLIEQDRDERANTYLVTTRSGGLANRLADQVVTLEEGRVVETADVSGALAPL
ncbi:MAG: ATP-binding cassette domain-containing protein [Thermoleophilaceae bacterium]|nr:ATP-binding cassette domain-containing protein [Thermoleophilaceae bacterium]